MVAVIAATSLAFLCPRPATAQNGTGTWSFDNTFHSDTKLVNGVPQPYSGPDAPLYYLNTSDASAGLARAEAVINDIGTAWANARLGGKVRIIAYWTPPYTPSYPGAPPAPTPPAKVTVRINSKVSAFYASNTNLPQLMSVSIGLDNGFGDLFTPASNDPFCEGTGWSSQGIHLKTLSTAGIVKDTTYPYGTRYKVVLPLDISLSADMLATGNGYDPYNGSPGLSAGRVQVRLGDINFQDSSIEIVVPKSDADVVKKGENEYVMSGSPFSIPCTVSMKNGTATEVENLRQHSSWSLSRSLPHQLPSAANGSSGITFFPQFLAPVTNTIQSGLGFNGMPADNSDFGFRYVDHNIDGMKAQSPIEVFYNPIARTHPSGGPEGWSNSAWWGHRVDTPNLVYYYSQAWKPPCTIKYRDLGSSAYLNNGEDYIWVGADITQTEGDSSDLFGWFTDASGISKM